MREAGINISHADFAVARRSLCLLARGALGGAAQLGELERRDVGGQLARGRKLSAEEQKQIGRLRDAAPDQRVEDVDRQDLVTPFGKPRTELDQPAVADFGWKDGYGIDDGSPKLGRFSLR
jgi:hypothetical protein